MTDVQLTGAALIAARFKANEAALKALMGTIEQGLIDLTGAVENASAAKQLAGIDAVLGSLESSVSDIVAAIEGADSSQAISRLIDVVGKLKPSITVNVPKPTADVTVQVNPTPINVEAIMPSPCAPIIHLVKECNTATWEVRIPGVSGERDRLMYIKRLDK